MVAGYHLIWTVYGYWLPNDPRGSTSKEVRVEAVKPLGDHHFGRKAQQPSSKQLHEFLKGAHDTLAHSVLPFDDDDIILVGATLGRQIGDRGYVCYACAVMPDHVHMVIRRNGDRAEEMIAHFQKEAKAALINAGKRAVNHSVWTDGPGWKTFINSQQQFRSEIMYIQRNPEKIGKP